jgi:hypothetical protein
LRTHLEALEKVLVEGGESEMARIVRRALDGSDLELRAFLVSNELWGGAGSIADQAGCTRSREARRSIEAVLVSLGRDQLGQGIANDRTGMWVEAFSKWQRGSG